MQLPCLGPLPFSGSRRREEAKKEERRRTKKNKTIGCFIGWILRVWETNGEGSKQKKITTKHGLKEGTK